MAPNTSFVVSPASSMARRAASAAIMRSDLSGCWPATTPRPTMAYLPDDECLGTCTSRDDLVALAPPHAGARPQRQLELTPLYLQPLERIVEQPIELAELAGIINTRQRACKVERLDCQQPAADGGAEAIADVCGFADPRRCTRVAQAPK